MATQTISPCPESYIEYHMLTSRYVLLIREDEQQRLLHLSVKYDPMQLLPGLVYPGAIIRVDNEDKSLCAYDTTSS